MSTVARIAVDAAGGDFAPSAVLDGVKLALAADPGVSVILAGPAAVVVPVADALERCRAAANPEAGP
ncbi:hypothetical protein EG835_02900 [bacterium]|nr:hypothetical protein [bacterium]